MKHSKLKKRTGWTGFCIMAVLGVPTISLAADHLDAPGLTSPGGDRRLDITDVYAFQSPSHPNNAVLIMNLFPLAGVPTPGSFHPDASYEFKIDNNGDAKEDLTFRITFSPVNASGEQDLLLRCTPASACGFNGAVLARGRTGNSIQVAGGGLIRAGLFDDPFFFDLNAFKHVGGRAFCDGHQTNFFRGLNVMSIVLEVPRDQLGSDHVGVWARTELKGEQIDRMGRPAINTVFIPNASKNSFNAGIPRNDTRDFSDFLGNFAGVLLPDVLTVNTASTAGFLNGRRLQDDVIDIELQVITGNPAAGDCVANDSAFTTTFPYLAPPN